MFTLKLIKFPTKNNDHVQKLVSCPNFTATEFETGVVKIIAYQSNAEKDGAEFMLADQCFIDSSDNTANLFCYDVCYVENGSGRTINTFRPKH